MEGIHDSLSILKYPPFVNKKRVAKLATSGILESSSSYRIAL
nr:MAG TPA: hypothetical protein [Caudoviricetes sp.]